MAEINCTQVNTEAVTEPVAEQVTEQLTEQQALEARIAFRKSLTKRVITALLMLLVVIVALAWKKHILFFLVMGISIIGLWEFYTIAKPKASFIMKMLGILMGCGIVYSGYKDDMGLMLAFTGSGFLFAAVAFLFSYGFGNDEARMEDWQYLPMGLLYIPLMLAPAISLSLYDQIIILLAAIGTDTGGFFAGAFMGKTKVWPRVSPKKTIAGSFGGLAVCVAACVIMGALFKNEQTSLMYFVLLGISLNIAAQLGDFFESALKRRASVKDSSSLLPGHGGILDRIDSLLFAIPVYCVLNAWLHFFAQPAIAAPVL